jgi:predicted GH43/DUF377 family glycosyl hydrolase
MHKLTVKKEGLLLERTSLYFESEAVFNPAVIRENGIIHLFYRAVSKGDFSSIGYCKLDSPTHIVKRNKHPLLLPREEFEKKGMEDPRIVKIDGIYYLTYTAFDGINALGALAISSDLKDFFHWGIIVPLLIEDENTELNKKRIVESYENEMRENNNVEFIWDKNVVFFPRKINGFLYYLHRIKPDILLVKINDLKDLTISFWEEYISKIGFFKLDCNSVHSEKALYFGAGCPPLETKKGWIFIYHAAYKIDDELIYKAHCILLDLENPLEIIAYLPYALIEPEYEWEIKGNVNNVVFPTGSILNNDQIFVYYGAADSRVACISFSLSELFTELVYLKKEPSNVN